MSEILELEVLWFTLKLFFVLKLGRKSLLVIWFLVGDRR